MVFVYVYSYFDYDLYFEGSLVPLLLSIYILFMIKKKGWKQNYYGHA